jgi:glycosyltransferase involved in cell wall biosynthesis
MFRLAYIVSHPIQYQAPLLRYLSRDDEIDLQVFFLSDFSLHDHYEAAFDQTFKWDTQLTEGYSWEVLPRVFSGSSAVLRPWLPAGGLRQRLRAGKFDAVWIHGWGHMGLCQAVREAVSLDLPVLMRGESTPAISRNVSIRNGLRDKFYRWLFRQITGFLCIGTRNREFYRQYGVPEHRLFSVPYAVDNAFFQARCSDAAPERATFRRSLDLQPGRPVLLFAGKFVPAKAPEELLDAFYQVHSRFNGNSIPYLLFVGDGPLRAKLEKRARPLGDSVRFLGFRNQSELPPLYDLCDLFVVPSRFEPWGLVVNEVMNAGRPVIVSDRVGAAPDLVVNGDNGFVYPSGDVPTLASRLLQIIESPNLRARMGQRSLKRISSWDFEADGRGLLEALVKVCQSGMATVRAIAR